MRVEVYRLMQFTLRDVLESKFGTEKADEVFYDAGKLAGVAFYKAFFGNIKDFNEFVLAAQTTLRDLGVGVLRVEQADLEKGAFVLAVAEDLDCSGLPELGHGVCIYDEGFISGLLESYSGKPYTVKEVDCWCTGGRTCRFTAECA
ncbi:MAG: 4-vinyl reductase [Proteobacteria bacterium]|nr:4-vinyl reductase [Pseudomonadota bacterium]MBU1594922.1 4-vinyl reductase [Pseudomonadota bacterium]